MGLSRRVLADGEEVVSEGRLHWIALGRPVAALVVAVAVLVAVVVTFPKAPVAVAEALVAVVAVVALWTAGRVLRWRSTVVAVTTLRLVERSGVLARRGEEIRLDRIAELSTRQSLVGMVLGFGTLIVDLGAGGKAVLHPVHRPGRLQAVLTDGITAYQRSMAGGWGPGRGAPAPWPDARGGRWDEPPTAAWDGAAWDGAAAWDEPPTVGWAEAPAAARGDPGAAERWDDAVPQWDDGHGADAGRGPAPPRPPAPGPGAWTADGGWATPPAGTAAVAGSVAERLATLHRLHQQGLVTDGEYAAKRAQLLELL